MQKSRIVKFSIRNKMIAMALALVVPFFSMAIYLIFAIQSYSDAYNRIVGNMTIANNYNIDFKEEMDESLYKLVVGYTTFDTIKEDSSLEDPYDMIDQMRTEFTVLMGLTKDKESRTWLQSLLRNMDTLEDRVDDIRHNIADGETYDINIQMLENNIYIMTELIQDDIQYYIYYQTVNMEFLKSQLDDRVNAFLVLVTGMMIVAVLFAVAASFLIVRSITKPLRQLTEVTNLISEGNFAVRANINSTDETAVLAQSINAMNANIEALVLKIKEDERKMHYADLRLLQEQINPHFLYNTLDTIIWLIEGKKMDQAVSMVSSLSDFFRLVLSKGKEFITIQEEEQHIRSYLEIQKVRYGDIMDYEITIDKELYPYKILKLTLQPLVENALYHGIKYKRAKGIIRIHGRMENDIIHFSVSDNGVGMAIEELERLRKDIERPCKESEKGFGLANVNERIRMNYGQEYSMKINSNENQGTHIDIRIPVELFQSEVAEDGIEE